MKTIKRLTLILPVAATASMSGGVLLPSQMLTHDPCDAAIATSHAFTGHHAAGGDVRVVTSGKRIRCAINKELFFRNRVVVDNEQSQEPRQVIDDMYQSN